MEAALSTGRGRRQLGVSSAQAALAQLAELKKNGGKRSAQFEVRPPPLTYAPPHARRREGRGARR